MWCLLVLYMDTFVLYWDMFKVKARRIKTMFHYSMIIIIFTVLLGSLTAYTSSGLSTSKTAGAPGQPPRICTSQYLVYSIWCIAGNTC